MLLSHFRAGVFLAAASAAINIGGVTAEEDHAYNPGPGLNLRPANITGLSYWLHGWVGSYYNGTATFHLIPQDWGAPDEKGYVDWTQKVCKTYRNRNITFSVDALLAITKPEAYDEGDQPAMVLLKTWVPGLDLVAANDSLLYPPEYDGLQYTLESVVPPFHDYNGQPDHPLWNLTMEPPPSESSYALSGTSKASHRRLTHTMPPCEEDIQNQNQNHDFDAHASSSSSDDDDEEAWNWEFWIEPASLLEKVAPALDATDTVFDLEFGERSASFKLRGWFYGIAQEARGGAGADFSELAGRVEIDFEGVVDGGRSDELVSGLDVPAWVETVGWPDGDEDGGGDGPESEAGRLLVGPYSGLLLLLSAVYYIVLM